MSFSRTISPLAIKNVHIAVVFVHFWVHLCNNNTLYFIIIACSCCKTESWGSWSRSGPRRRIRLPGIRTAPSSQNLQMKTFENFPNFSFLRFFRADGCGSSVTKNQPGELLVHTGMLKSLWTPLEFYISWTDHQICTSKS